MPKLDDSDLVPVNSQFSNSNEVTVVELGTCATIASPHSKDTVDFSTKTKIEDRYLLPTDDNDNKFSNICGTNDLTIKDESDRNEIFMSTSFTTPSFKRGVMCCSTPISLSPPPKRPKRDYGLEPIEEENYLPENSEETLKKNYRQEGSVEARESDLPIGCSNESLASMAKDNEVLELTSGIPSTIEKTILQKDHQSIVFDLPYDEKPDIPEKKDCEIKFNDDATIVYKDIEDRTIDEIHLNDGKLGLEIEEMFNLESEEDRQRILEKAKNLQEFISPDNEENNDNNNSEWDVLKKLESDEERYKAVRQLWMNLAIPNPKENLSNFNWRKRNGMGHPKQNQLPKAPLKQDSEALSHHCTDVFDVASKKLSDFYKDRCRGIGIDTTYEHAVMASLKKMPNEVFYGGKRGFMLTYDQFTGCYQERYDRTQNAKKEIEALHAFYNGLKNRKDGTNSIILLSEREHNNVLAVEDIITSYSSWYRN